MDDGGRGGGTVTVGIVAGEASGDALAGTLIAAVRERHPNVRFAGVDAPDFNLGLERRLKRRGVRTIHFVGPSLWAWRPERLATMGQSVDRMLVLFPFEPPLYERAGIPVSYVGHPAAAAAAGAHTRRVTRETLRLRAATPVFALLPGSRLSEIEMHAELVLDAAARIVEARPDAEFLVPLV